MSKRVAIAEADDGSETECDCENCSEFWTKIHDRVTKYYSSGKCIHRDIIEELDPTLEPTANHGSQPIDGMSDDLSRSQHTQDRWAFLRQGASAEPMDRTKGRKKNSKQ